MLSLYYHVNISHTFCVLMRFHMYILELFMAMKMFVFVK